MIFTYPIYLLFAITRIEIILFTFKTIMPVLQMQENSGQFNNRFNKVNGKQNMIFHLLMQGTLLY
jgi:hypothetical protein